MKKKAAICTLAIAIPAVLLLTAAGLIWFSFEPPQAPPKIAMVSADFTNQFQVMQQIMRLISKKKMPETAVLKITPAQFNSMLKTGAMFRTKNFSLQAYNLHVCPDGALKFRYGHDTKMRWLHGGVLPVSGKVEFHKKDAEIDVRFQTLAAGLLVLPESVGKQAVENFIARYRSTPEYRFFTECIQSLVFDDKAGCFFITVRPRLLRNIF